MDIRHPSSPNCNCHGQIEAKCWPTGSTNVTGPAGDGTTARPSTSSLDATPLNTANARLWLVYDISTHPLGPYLAARSVPEKSTTWNPPGWWPATRSDP